MGIGDARNLIADIAGQAGVDQLDLGEVTGTIDGYVIEQPMTAADALSPVLSYLGLSVAERGEGLRLIGSAHGVDTTLTRDDLAYNEQSPVLARRDLVTPPASLSLRCYDIDRDYQLLAVTVRGDEAGASQMSMDLPLVLSAAQAMDYAGYVLRAAQAVREAEVSASEWAYAERAADFPGGLGSDARVEIAQTSQVYGYGPVLSVALA